MVLVGAGLLLLGFIALSGGALVTAILLGVGGLALMVVGALRHARSLDG
jgi:hypothetical protein